MPSTVANEIGRTLDRTSKAIHTATQAAMKEASKVAGEELDKTAPLVPGADRQFSNFTRAGPLRTKARFFKDSEEVLISPVGPWGIAERGAKPHRMKAWGRGTANHPGTRRKQGRKAWSRGRDATFRRLEREVPEAIAKDVEEAFVRG